MSVTSVQCSQSLSEHPHPLRLHLHLSPFPPISPLFVCSRSLRLLSLLCFFFLQIWTAPSSSCCLPSSWPPSSIRRLLPWACDSDGSHLINTAHTLYSNPSLSLSITTYSLNTKARTLKRCSAIMALLRYKLSQYNMQTLPMHLLLIILFLYTYCSSIHWRFVSR